MINLLEKITGIKLIDDYLDRLNESQLNHLTFNFYVVVAILVLLTLI
jgi:hypothetical protein